MQERIETFNQARGGGVAVHTAGRGRSLASQRAGASPTSFKPTGEADKVQVLPWDGQCWGASKPFGISTMPLDAALDDIASDPRLRTNA